jgi:hypothetical protein
MRSRRGRSFCRAKAEEKFPSFKSMALNVMNQTSIAM